MSEYFEKIINIQTGKETIREFTQKEIDEIKKEQERHQIILNEIKEKEKLRQSALAKLIDLGLTEEEIAAL